MAQVDLESEETLAAAEAAIRSINCSATIERTLLCKLDVGSLLDLAAYSTINPASFSNPDSSAREHLSPVSEARDHRNKHLSEHLSEHQPHEGPCTAECTVEAEAEGRGDASYGDAEAGAGVSSRRELDASSHLHGAQIGSVTLSCEKPLELSRYTRSLHSLPPLNSFTAQTDALPLFSAPFEHVAVAIIQGGDEIADGCTTASCSCGQFSARV